MTPTKVATNPGPRVRRSEWLALAAIASPFVIGWVLVSPWQDVPIIDDWVYAWSVEHLLKTGQLRVAEISAVYPIAQILWGALVSRIVGFSFGALRLSTVMLAVAGCWALYLTLREVGIAIATSLLAALTVACYPTYFALAFTFMTDVPFVSVTSIALFFYVSGLHRDRPTRLWLGSVFAIAAFLIRSVGVVLPIAVLGGLGWERVVSPARGIRKNPIPAFVLPPAIALLATAALWLALPRALGPLAGERLRLAELRGWFLVPATAYIRWNLNLVFIAAFPFAPLLVGLLTRKRTALRVAVMSAMLFVMLRLMVHSLPSPLPDWQTWSLQDIAARAMIGGTEAPSAWSVRATPFVSAAGVVIVAALSIALASLACRRPLGGRILIALGALNLVLINVLWLYNDRYYLVLVPTLAYVAAAAMPVSQAANLLAAAAITGSAFISVTGTRDMLAISATSARSARELESQGVLPSDIDAGYSLNGWRLYVHPENLPANADRRYDVPFVTSKPQTLYRIASSPLSGYDVVKVEKLPAALWQVTDRLYVVRRQKATTASPVVASTGRPAIHSRPRSRS